jgi:tRNA (cmo5U34)-methyltransferase
MAQLGQDPHSRRYGHEWKNAAKVSEYVERIDREDPRAEGFVVLAAVVPFPREQPIRVLDVGAGQGTVSSVLLDKFPAAQAIGVDVSEPMMEIGRERMAQYGERFAYHVGDFVDGDLPANLPGPFDVVVSSRAIHHLPTATKQRLYGQIYACLNRGGAFFNLDGVAPPDERLRDIYRSARGSRPERSADGMRSPGHYFESLEEHLGLLRTAGFAPVDCFWKRLNLVLLGGYG